MNKYDIATKTLGRSNRVFTNSMLEIILYVESNPDNLSYKGLRKKVWKDLYYTEKINEWKTADSWIEFIFSIIEPENSYILKRYRERQIKYTKALAMCRGIDGKPPQEYTLRNRRLKIDYQLIDNYNYGMDDMLLMNHKHLKFDEDYIGRKAKNENTGTM
jgi:hypothetical protein